MKPIRMSDGYREITGTDTSSVASVGAIAYNKDIADFAKENGIKYRYAFQIVSLELSDKEKSKLILEYKKY